MNLDNSVVTFTKVYYGSENANNAILHFIDNSKRKIDSCISSIAPSVIIEVDSFEEKRVDAFKNRGLKLRYVTEITKDNINYVKEMLTFSEIRHLEGMKGNFEVADEKEYIAFANLNKSQAIPQLIFSNLSEIVEQQQFIFDSFWDKAIPAEQRIKEIEEGIVPPIAIVFSDYKDALEKELTMIKNATKEIQIIYSTINAFHLQEQSGTLQLLKEMAEQNQDLNIRILTPIDTSIKQALSRHLLFERHHNIQFQDIAPSFNIKIKTLVVDKKESLIMELKHMKGEKETASIGFSIYSNSEPTVLSYASIFEVLYNQSMLFQQLKQEDNIKSEFINVAAHELRTPIMPILNGMEILEEKLGERIHEFKRETDIITRNALRLQTLAESILQVSRIESGSFSINIQSGIDIHFLISQVIEDIEKKYAYTEKVNRVSVLFLPNYNEKNKVDTSDSEKAKHEKEKDKEKEKNIPTLQSFYIDCDSQKISQVIFNLLDNAMKFTAEGKIVVSVFASIGNGYLNYKDMSKTSEIKLNDDNYNTSNNDDKENYIVISVQDTGIGISKKIKDHLFEKFATKSIQGTGLGLYLSKKIVEAHNGLIWFEEPNYDEYNNPYYINENQQKIGTIFRFSLPITNSSSNRKISLDKKTSYKNEEI